VYNEQLDGLVKRLKVLEGAKSIGDDNPSIQKEMKTIIHQLYQKGVFSTGYYNQFKRAFPILLNLNNQVSTNQYKYTFSQPIDFSQYEVALGSISIYYSWRAITAQRGNNTFKVIWPTGSSTTTYTITLSDGTYTANDINNYLQYFCIQNNLYLINNTTGSYYYFISCAVNTSSYAIQFTMQPGQGIAYCPMQGTNSEITISFFDQNMLPLQILDNNVCIRLLMRQKKGGDQRYLRIGGVGTFSSLAVARNLDCGSLSISGSSVDLSLLSGLTAGTVAASKLVLVDANKDITGFRNLTATTLNSTNLHLGGSQVYSTATELNYLSGVTPGISAGSTAVVTGPLNNISNLFNVASQTFSGDLIAPTSVTYEVALGSISIYYSWRAITAQRGNNTFKVIWPTGSSTTTYTITLSDGTYTANDINNYLQYFCIQNNLYLINNTTGSYYYFISCAVNTSSYAIQFTMQPVKNLTGYTAASGFPTMPATAYTPQLQIVDSLFGAIVGLTPATYPAAQQTTAYAINSNVIPQIDPTAAIIVGLSNLYNPIANNNQVFHTFTAAGVEYGALITTTQGQGIAYCPMQGTNSEITISFFDQNMLPLQILDNNGLLRRPN
ncbi:TPA: hypothetical protein N0F65_012873, partial [Lagenidium giganteum]